MVVIDSQVHIWLPQSDARRWVRDEPHLPNPLTYEDLIRRMDEAGVDGAILVPPSWEGDRNDYALAASHAYPNRFAVMGRLAIAKPDAREQLQHIRDDPAMLGIRLTFHRPQNRVWMEDGTADWLWPEAERLNVPLMLHAPHALDSVSRIAERHPGLKVIIDHMGMGRESIDENVGAGVARVCRLARHPNVAVKLSSLPCFSSQGYPFQNITPHVRTVVDSFGADRCFWGTDLSRTLPRCSYRESVTHFTEQMPFLTAGELERIMGSALAEFLDWRPAVKRVDV